MAWREKFAALLGRGKQEPQDHQDHSPGYDLGAEGAFALPVFPDDPEAGAAIVPAAQEAYAFAGIVHPIPEDDEPFLGIG